MVHFSFDMVGMAALKANKVQLLHHLAAFGIFEY